MVSFLSFAVIIVIVVVVGWRQAHKFAPLTPKVVDKAGVSAHGYVCGRAHMRAGRHESCHSVTQLLSLCLSGKRASTSGLALPDDHGEVEETTGVLQRGRAWNEYGTSQCTDVRERNWLSVVDRNRLFGRRATSQMMPTPRCKAVDSSLVLVEIRRNSAKTISNVIEPAKRVWSCPFAETSRRWTETNPVLADRLTCGRSPQQSASCSPGRPGEQKRL